MWNPKAAWIMTAASLLLTPLGTQAQEVRAITVRAGMGPGSDAGMISKRSVEKYADLLGLDDATRDSVRVSHEGYAAAWQQAQKTRREGMDAIRREVEESDDHALWGTRMPEVEKTFRETSAKIEREFLADMQLMAGDKGQGDAWTRVERMRRREQALVGGGMSGEGVDLVDLVGTLALPAEVAAGVNPTLVEYETEMDRFTQAKIKSMQDRGSMFGMGRRNIDPAQIDEMMKESRETGQKIRDVNARFARRLEGELPEDLRAKFADEFRKRSFPMVYRASRAQRELDAAVGMSDLTPDQKEQLALLQESHQREARTANDTWSGAIEEQEKSGQSSGASFGGAQIMVMNGDEPEAIKNARQARRDLDKRTRDRLKSILTPAQKERLPKESDEEMVGGQRAFFIEAR